MQFVEDLAEGDPVSVAIVAGAILILTLALCFCCGRRRQRDVADASWEVAGEGYLRRLEAVSSAVQAAYELRLDRSVVSAMCQSADEQYRARLAAAASGGANAPIGPTSAQVARDPRDLRRQICEWPSINAPVIDVAERVFNDIAATLQANAYLVHFYSEDATTARQARVAVSASDTEGVDDGDDPAKCPVDPATRDERLERLSSGCCGRCCCVTAKFEEKSLTRSEHLMCNHIAKAFLVALGPNAVAMVARFAARGWVSPSLVTVAQAVVEREKLAKQIFGSPSSVATQPRRSSTDDRMDQELDELSPPREVGDDADPGHRSTTTGDAYKIVFSCSPMEAVSGEEPADRLTRGDAVADLYLRTCGMMSGDSTSSPSSTVAHVVMLRADLAAFLKALRSATATAPVPDAVKTSAWFYQVVDSIDKQLAATLYARRAREMRHALAHWETATMADVERMLASVGAELKAQAASASSNSFAGGASGEHSSPSRINDEDLRAFLNDFLDAATSQYHSAFTRDPEHENPALVAQCCGSCIPTFPHVRRIRSGEAALKEHLMSRLSTAAAKNFAVREDHRTYAARILSELKIDVLDRIMGSPPPSSASASGEDDGEDDEALDPLAWSSASGEDTEDGEDGHSRRRRRRRRRGGGSRRRRRHRDPLAASSSSDADPGAYYELPDTAYAWLPRNAPPDLVRILMDDVDATPSRVADTAMREVARLEDEIAIAVSSRDPSYQRMEDEILSAIRGAADQYVTEMAYVSTMFKKLLRWSTDACATNRQGVMTQLAVVLRELREIITTVRSDTRFDVYRAWIPLGQIVQSFNVLATKCSGIQALHQDPREVADVAPAPPPRDDS